MCRLFSSGYCLTQSLVSHMKKKKKNILHNKRELWELIFLWPHVFWMASLVDGLEHIGQGYCYADAVSFLVMAVLIASTTLCVLTNKEDARLSWPCYMGVQCSTTSLITKLLPLSA